MKIEMNTALIVLALAFLTGAYGDWSWGNSGKGLETKAEASVASTTTAASDTLEGEGRNAKSLQHEILPLEGEGGYEGDYVDLTGAADLSSASPSEVELDEEGRNARFLGISNKLCKFGVKGLCEKQQGYPPAVGTHYGNSIGNGNSLGSSYGSYASPAIPIVYEEYPSSYPDVKVSPPKKPFTKIFSDIFNPKKSKGPSKSHGSASPLYGPPPPVYGPPKPAYGAPKPEYGPPQPAYIVPEPSYSAPVKPYPPTQNYGAPPPKPYYPPPTKSYVEPKPIYSAPKPTYKQPINTYGAPKPTDVLHHKVLPLHTQVIEGSKVQHLHTHTHIYNSPIAPISPYDIRVGDNFPRDDGIYQATSEVKTTVDKDSAFSGDNSFQNFNDDKSFKTFNNDQSSQNFNNDQSFQNFNNDQSFQNFNSDQSSQNFNNHQSSQDFNNDKSYQIVKLDNVFQNSQKESFGAPFKPSQSVPFIDGFQTSQSFQTNQDKRHINQDTLNSFNSFGAKDQSFQSSINQLTNSFSSNTFQRAYPVDCQCVERQYCASSDLIARTNSNDIGHLLDARNDKSEVLSNSTEVASNATQNATQSSDYYDYDYLHYAEASEDDVSITTTLPEVEDETNGTSTVAVSTTTGAPEAGRVRRDVNESISFNATETTAAPEGLSGRQLTGFSPGVNGCGQDYVCCRRPVYVAAQRSTPTCGRGNPSIHGRVSTFEYESGQADFGEYPWQAAILREEGPESMFVCGATLIDNLHLLTAAHCVNDLKVNTLKVRLGEWDVNRDTEFYKHVEIPVASVIIHPDFYKGNLYNDIAIITMADFADIESSPHIAPVCLPTPNTDFTNYRCHVTGWGKDAFGDKGNFQHILKELEIPVVSRKSCEYSLQTTRLGAEYKLHEGFICAGGEEGKDACKGDGGGPLVCTAGDKSFQLAGIVSWGVGCGQQGIPGVYVNIPYYVDWIRSSIGF